MNKGIKFLLAAIIVGGLGYWAYTLMNGSNSSDKELLNFAIEDVSNIDKIIITDQNNYAFEVHKNTKEKWVDKNENCVMQTNVEFILEAFQNIRFKGYLPDNSIKKHKSLIASKNIKVEIFENGQWIKTWFIGQPSKDQYGQIMMLKTKNDGTSDKPVLMKLKGHRGIIDAMFYSDPRKWECTEIYAHQLDEIKKVEVINNEDPLRSFSVERKGAHFNVKQNGTPITVKDTSSIFRYLQNFKKVHYNLANYELNDRQIDSLVKTKPFAVLSVTTSDNQTKSVKCFRIFKTVYYEDGTSEQQADPDKFWTELPGKQVVKSQYFVFNPLLLGDLYFPMKGIDKSGWQ